MNCYVLLGGRSTRFGTPKREALWEGSTFLQRVQVAAADAFDDVWYVGKQFIPGVRPDRMLLDAAGAASAAIFGVHRAIDHATDEKFWVLAVDYPLITSAALSHLRDIFASAPESLLVPEWHELPQMLCAGYSKSLGALVAEQIGVGEWKLQSLLCRAPSRVVEENELRRMLTGEPLWNINDPVELEKARRKYGQ